ncbi:MAG: glycosyltransferase family 39 protein [Acidobacteriota bacterium]
MIRQVLVVVAFVVLLRAPFLNHPVQGDDVYYLYGAQHAQIEPLHPLHTQYAFLGQMVDMRGHPHGPLNPWILGALLALVGGVREVPFHAGYLLLSLVAALSMLSLARRFVPGRPLMATLLFLATPAFVVNGTSFEADLPLVAFWLTSMTLFARALDTRSGSWLLASMVAGALAGLDAYQAVMLSPLLGLYLWLRCRSWKPAWIAIFAAPGAIAAWQLWEWSTSGVLPAAVLAGYMQSGGYQSFGRKLGSAVALFAHAGWLVFPVLIVAAAAKRMNLYRWTIVVVATVAALIYEPNPLFWISAGVGVLLLVHCARKELLGAWILMFFAAALLIFFAGSARYLLPIAGIVAIVVARELPSRWLFAGFAIQLVLSFSLALANAQQWSTVRTFASRVMREANGRRVWVNAEWGLRHYLEAQGALPLLRDQVVHADDIIVSSDLGQPVEVNAPLIELFQTEVIPVMPLRLISLEGKSGYSSSAKGVLPFEISGEIVDRLHAYVVSERKPEMSYLDPKDPKAAAHVIHGLFPDGWMTQEASVLLKVPDKLASLEVKWFIPTDAPARRITLLVDGKVVAEDTVAKPGAYSLSAPFRTQAHEVTVGLRVDATHTVPPDGRALGVVITGVGMRQTARP